jgi:chemotaxis signal transduction protein
MKSVLPLHVNGAWVAIDALGVVEILGPAPWVGLPGAPALTPGIIAYRGRAVPALDLGAALGVGSSLVPGEVRRRTIVVHVGKSTLALYADAVREVQEIAGAALLPSQSASARPRGCVGEVEIQATRAPVLDLSIVLQSPLPPSP